MCSVGRGTLDDFGVSPWQLKDTYHLSQEIAVPRKSLHAATTLIHLKQYKFKVVQNLKQAQHVVRAQFCNWLCEAVCNDENGPLLTYFTD